MELTLSPADAHILRDFLSDYLQEVRFEAARTEARELRHTMVQRQELLERLLVQLERA